MKSFVLSVFVLLMSATRCVAVAGEFASELDLSPIEILTVQDQQTLKTFDSYARQTLTAITNKRSLDGNPATFVILDMTMRPEQYRNRNLIYIKHVPLRQDLQELKSLDPAEKKRILEEGTVSLMFWIRDDVQQFVRHLEASAVHKAQSIQLVDRAANLLGALVMGDANFPPVRLITPATDDRQKDHHWKKLGEIAGNVPAWADSVKAMGKLPPARVEGYDDQLLGKVALAAFGFMDGWRQQNAELVNAKAIELSQLLPQVNPDRYPSEAKRRVEVIYNRLAKLTIPGAAMYFAAFVAFLVAARSSVGRVRLWGLRLFVVGFLIHTLGIAIRWWLVEKSVGNWFESIPIKNQFESVLFSAWFGALVGLILEIRRPRGIFGAAASFVGWMSLIAIFATPFVAGRGIGEEIGQVNGVLMSYWLYIHVTLVTASYALIGMSFMLGTWWLIRYYTHYGTVSRQPARQISSDVARWEMPVSAGASGGAISIGFLQTLAMILFMSRGKERQARSAAALDIPRDVHVKNFLATLDLCHLVILQLAFWILGVGILTGAIWADMSWGRPWAWDPKETFALVTWIVYLIVVHVRVATEDKAWWTAVLSVIGFFVMLFNWIGVNFFLVGLHSYA